MGLHFHATANTVLQALELVSQVIERRAPLPILSCVLVDVSSDRVTLSGTDLDNELSLDLSVPVFRTGAVCIAADPLLRFLKVVPFAELLFTETIDDDGTAILSVTSDGGAEVKLPINIDAADMPAMKFGSPATRFRMARQQLDAMLGEVDYAMATEETRFYLMGVYLHLRDQSLVAIATDGHRMGWRKVPPPAGSETFAGEIVPRHTVKLLRALHAAEELRCGDETMLDLAFTDSHKLEVRGLGWRLRAKCIDASFPDYWKIIPTANDQVMTVDRDALLRSLTVVTAIRREKTASVILELGKDSLGLATADPGVGSCCDDIAAVYAGKPMFIGLNAKYLRDTLAGLQAGNIRFAFRDPGSPVLVDTGLTDRGHVLMPIRISGGGMSSKGSEPKRDRLWYPADMVEERAPPGRASPSDWIRDVLPSGAGQTKPDYAIGTGEDDDGWEDLTCTVGDTFSFTTFDSFPSITIELKADHEYEIVRGSVPRGANWFAHDDHATDDDIYGSLDDFVREGLAENAEVGDEVTVSIGCWGDDIPFRLELKDGTPSFVEVKEETAP